MLETLITSKTRVKLLYKFFLNGDARSYLRGLEDELNESSNSIRLELNKFESAGFLTSELDGNKKLFKANKKHPLFQDIHRIVLKITGIDHVIDYILQRLGNLETVYLVGDLAKGKDTEVIDLILVGDINKAYLIELVWKAEKKTGKKIRFICYQSSEFSIKKITEPGLHPLKIWGK
jgi:hypothetical protein